MSENPEEFLTIKTKTKCKYTYGQGLEKAMAPQYSLAWKLPWVEAWQAADPWGRERVGHN